MWYRRSLQGWEREVEELKYVRVLFMSEGRMEQETDSRSGHPGEVYKNLNYMLTEELK